MKTWIERLAIGLVCTWLAVHVVTALMGLQPVAATVEDLG